MRPVDEPGRLAEPADDRRLGHRGRTARVARGDRRTPPDLALDLPHLHRAGEVGRQLGGGQPGPVELGPRLGLLLEAAVDHQGDRFVAGHPVAVDLRVDDRVGDRAQVELPVREQERGIVGAVAGVHHHLGDVDRPALGVQAAAEDRPDERRAAVGVDPLEVVPGNRLVDRQQAEHPVVVLAQVRLTLLVGPVVGHRGDREERLLAPVQRPRRDEHRATEGTQEDRRPLDLERLVGQADQVALAAERLDPGVLRAAEVEQRPRPSDAPRRRRRARHGRSAPSSSGTGPLRDTRSATASVASRTSSPRTATYSRSASARIRSGVSVSERIVWRILAANSSRPRRPSPSLAGRTTSRRWASNAASAASRPRRRRPSAGDQRPATAGSSRRARAAARASSICSPIPGSWRRAASVWNRPTGRSGRSDQALPGRVEHAPASPRADRRSTPVDRPVARTRGPSG